MTVAQQIDIGLFIIIAILCAVAFWRADQYPSDLAQRVRLRAAGIIVWMSLLPIKVFLVDAFSTAVWAALLALILVGGGLLFYGASRKD